MYKEIFLIVLPIIIMILVVPILKILYILTILYIFAILITSSMITLELRIFMPIFLLFLVKITIKSHIIYENIYEIYWPILWLWFFKIQFEKKLLLFLPTVSSHPNVGTNPNSFHPVHQYVHQIIQRRVRVKHLMFLRPCKQKEILLTTLKDEQTLNINYTINNIWVKFHSNIIFINWVILENIENIFFFTLIQYNLLYLITSVIF